MCPQDPAKEISLLKQKKLLVLEKNKKASIFCDKENTRNQQSRSKHLYISSFFECSFPKWEQTFWQNFYFLGREFYHSLPS